jgi:aspartate 1-decarboxylase
MRRTLLKSKLHRATVTAAELHYEGSVTIDSELMRAAGIVPYEQVDIYDVTNGQRITTYAILGEPGSGEVCINGAAAHRVRPGDIVIIVCYAEFEEQEIASHQPRVIQLDAENRVRDAVDLGAAG